MVNSARRSKRSLPRLPSLLAIAIALASVEARADFTLQHWENRQVGAASWKLWSDLRYFDTSSNYDASGASVRPLTLQSYSQTRLDIGGQYGITDRISLFGRLSWSYIQLGTTQLTSSAFGFGDQTVGANARLVKTSGGISIDGQVQMDFATYSNANAAFAGRPFLGDGSLDITAGGFVAIPFDSDSSEGSFSLTGGLGYTMRSDNFSSAVPWSVIAAYAPQQTGVFASLGVVGFQSLKTDDRTNFPTLQATAGQGTGGSFMTGAINPTMASIRGQLGYQTSSELTLLVSAEQTLTGTNAPRGFAIGGGLQLRAANSEGARSARSTPEAPSARLGDTPRGFQSYSLDARVLRMNDRLGVVRIDKGSDAGISRGEFFDIFRAKPDGTPGEVVARGQVAATNDSQADVRITEYFKEVWIEEGFHAKRLVK
jgi:hypothetical protein